ncbi:hypothetical protein [Oceanobacillus sp. CF4.6]|uniref:hypothetical protein n=1 Tax=Oceanobacillus sp. CF4.6 TaxID=3373080 RepID=UPI003EE5BF98
MDNNNPMHHQFQGTYQPMDHDIKATCRRYMNYHVIAQMGDGSQFDGIIESMDDDGVTMLVPEEVDAEQVRQNEEGVARQFGFDFDDYNDYDDYGRPRRRRFRRFRRQRFPFRLFRSLFPYPYYYPYYPYYPGY